MNATQDTIPLDKAQPQQGRGMTLQFGQKLALGILTLVGVTLAGVLAATGAWTREAVEAQLDRDLAAADDIVAEVLQIRSRELAMQTRLLATGALLRADGGFFARERAALLDDARRARKLLESDLLYLVDDGAKLHASASEPERYGENMAGNAAVEAALQGRSCETMLAADDGIYQVVGVPLRDGERIVGAVVSGFAVGDPLLANLESTTGSLVALWTSSVTQLSNRARPVFGDLASRIVAAPGHSSAVETASGRYLVRIGEIGSSGVSYALARSLDEALLAYEELGRRIIATGVLLLLAALGAGYLWSRRITRPLEALVGGADRLAAGELATRVEVASRDEIGRLAGAFNRMATEIQTLIEEERELAAHDARLNAELVTVNAELKDEIEAHRRADAEIKRLNEDLEARVVSRTAELEAANRQLESFSYSVSHDLRGPLTRITGFADILLAETASRLDEAERDSLERIRASAAGMERMIAKLLEFSHIGRSAIEGREVDLSAMARGILEELAISNRARKADLVVADGLKVTGDEELLSVAMQNLLSNAWKFTSHRPKTRIEVGSEAANGHGRCIYVRDNGAGFESSKAERVFDVFERLHSARDFEGHGIGLATVKRIVEHHGGRIWADSSPGAGATFRFTLGRQGTGSGFPRRPCG